MAVKRIGYLVGRIDCPVCLSVLQWTNNQDINIDNQDRYIVCPYCRDVHHIVPPTKIYLDPNINYLTMKWEANADQGIEPSSDLVNFATVDTTLIQE